MNIRAFVNYNVVSLLGRAATTTRVGMKMISYIRIQYKHVHDNRLLDMVIQEITKI